MESTLEHLAIEPDTPAPSLHWEALHPKARIGLRLGAMLGFGLVYAIPATVLLAVWDSDGWSGIARWVLYLVGFALIAWLGWRYAAAAYARTQFALDEAGLRIRRGIVWRSETLVPRSRVQHIDLNRGPLDRRYGLATLKVYTAGTKLASVSVDGLHEARAAELRDALVTSDDDAV
jgi:membrane protein YdbS with pleckstrin-like domain